MKLRIKSDGSPFGTKILDENDNELEDVVSVTWTVGVGRLATATITLTLIEADVLGELEIATESASGPQPETDYSDVSFTGLYRRIAARCRKGVSRLARLLSRNKSSGGAKEPTWPRE